MYFNKVPLVSTFSSKYAPIQENDSSSLSSRIFHHADINKNKGNDGYTI